MSEFLSEIFHKIFSKPFILEFTKFAIVGAIGTVVNLSILYLLTDIFKIYYLISEIIAFFISVLNNYVINKIWTFKEEFKENMVKKFIQYSIVSVISLAVNIIILFVLVEYFYIWYIFAEVIAIVAAFLVNFVGNKLWTFRENINKNQEK